jgi:hypothetical protein
MLHRRPQCGSSKPGIPTYIYTGSAVLCENFLAQYNALEGEDTAESLVARAWTQL